MSSCLWSCLRDVAVSSSVGLDRCSLPGCLCWCRVFAGAAQPCRRPIVCPSRSKPKNSCRLSRSQNFVVVVVDKPKLPWTKPPGHLADHITIENCSAARRPRPAARERRRLPSAGRGDRVSAHREPAVGGGCRSPHLLGVGSGRSPSAAALQAKASLTHRGC